jgi:hypothetical protein
LTVTKYKNGFLSVFRGKLQTPQFTERQGSVPGQHSAAG